MIDRTMVCCSFIKEEWETRTRVESPITEHVSIIKHFPIYFPNSLAKLTKFCVIECTNWRATNVL
jgi:hypothetical protein